MIAHIEGRLDLIESDRIVVDVAGVGYEIFAGGSVLSSLPAKGEKVKILTYLNVKEDLLQLFGFASKEEKGLFLHLLSVSGIGPKSALNILSSFDIKRLVVAITKGDVDLLKSAPGIGRKTAERVIVELKEKIAKAYSLEASGGLPGSVQETPSVKDAVSALMALGYSAKEAKEAVNRTGLDLGSASIEEIIKRSLKGLS